MNGQCPLELRPERLPILVHNTSHTPPLADMKFSGTIPILLFSSIVSALPLTDQDHRSTTPLEWGPCELPGIPPESITSPIQCTKLAVPLDYTNTNSEKLQLQLLKVNATKEPVLGSVLFNPGGPGSSAVEDLAEKGHIYGEVLGGQYDLIAFDPRGTGRTIPFSCSINWTEAPTGTDLKPRNAVLQQDLVDVLDSAGWEQSKYVAERCFEENNKTGSYLSTAFVARDMVQIIDALSEDGMLRYWGMSYGTLLGQTFAAMFPDRVDRMLLDAVGDAPDYMAGDWLTSLEDTERSLVGFFQACVSAGTDLCAIANVTGADTTAADLLSAFNAGLESLQKDPIIAPPTFVPMVWNPVPTTTLYSALKSRIFADLYHPTRYPDLAIFMYPLLTRNFSAYLEPPPPEVIAAVEAAATILPYDLGIPDAFWGIGCTDASFHADSPEEMHRLVQEQEAKSGMSDAFVGKTWPCAQWNMKAAERYRGSFEGKTKFPILFVNGNYDPITPMSSARTASAKFEGSVVLSHGGNGHKLMRHPSICTAKAVRSYFVNGTMPEEGTICEPDVGAFEVAAAGGEGASSEEDRRLLRRMVEYASLDKGGDWGMRR